MKDVNSLLSCISVEGLNPAFKFNFVDQEKNPLGSLMEQNGEEKPQSTNTTTFEVTNETRNDDTTTTTLALKGSKLWRRKTLNPSEG